MGRARSLRRERPRMVMSGLVGEEGGEGVDGDVRRRSVPRVVDQVHW